MNREQQSIGVEENRQKVEQLKRNGYALAASYIIGAGNADLSGVAAHERRMLDAKVADGEYVPGPLMFNEELVKNGQGFYKKLVNSL